MPIACRRRLSVRGREGGETLKPAAGAKTQSVQHLCQSQGVLPWMRDALPLVFAADALIAVGDLWLDARLRARRRDARVSAIALGARPDYCLSARIVAGLAFC